MPPKAKAGAPKKGKNYKLPDPIPEGKVLTDIQKRNWRLGKSVGIGGFGEIYTASEKIEQPVKADAVHVVKIEPHANGPLFVEMSFYTRVAKPEKIQEWMAAHKQKFLGMPAYIGSGSHEYRGEKYRFLVMQRFGADIQKMFESNGRSLPLGVAFNIGLKVIDVLEYIHDKQYVHADIKGSNLLLGFGKGKENEVWLVDFGLACRYATESGHKEYKADPKKAHNGTIEFTSRDAHIGAFSRRGDLEILAYNLVQWLCGRLPWEDKLTDCEYVAAQKNRYMADIPLFMKTCFGQKNPPGAVKKFLELVTKLKFEEQPKYEAFREILRQGLKEAGQAIDGKLSLGLKDIVSPRKKKAAAQDDSEAEVMKKVRKITKKPSPQKSVGRARKAVESSSSSLSDKSADNVTVPAKKTSSRVNHGNSIKPQSQMTNENTSSVMSGDDTPLRTVPHRALGDSRFFTPESSLVSSTPISRAEDIVPESSSDSSVSRLTSKRKKVTRTVIESSTLDESNNDMEARPKRQAATRTRRIVKKVATSTTATQTTPGVMKVPRVTRRKPQQKPPPVVDLSSDMFDE